MTTCKGPCTSGVLSKRIGGARLACGVRRTIRMSVLAGVWACACGPKPSDDGAALWVAPEKRDIPFLILVETPGYPRPGKPVGGGIVAAIWLDGSIVRVPPGSGPRNAYVKGKLGPDQLEQLLARVHALGLSQEAQDRVIVDAPALRMYLRGKDGVTLRAESLEGGPKVGVSELKSLVTSFRLGEDAPYCPPWAGARLKDMPKEWGLCDWEN